MTGTRVLLLHGFEHHRPSGHWMWWLAESLREERVPVQYPQMPAPDRPVRADWTSLMRGELAMLAGGAERVVLAHSLGCIAWLHLARELEAPLRVDRVLLVAPPHPDRLTGPLADFALSDGVDVDAVSRAARSTTVVARAEDPYHPGGVAPTAAAWGLPYREIPGTGHLNVDDGHGPWPAAHAWATTGDLDLSE